MEITKHSILGYLNHLMTGEIVKRQFPQNQSDGIVVCDFIKKYTEGVYIVNYADDKHSCFFIQFHDQHEYKKYIIDCVNPSELYDTMKEIYRFHNEL